MVMQRSASREQVTRFGQFCLATGGLPLLRVGDARLLRGPFDVAITITDNAVVAASTLLTPSLWDKRVQAAYTASSSAQLEAILRYQGFGVYINDGDFRTETPSLKESLDNLLYIRVARSTKAMDYPMRGHIWEAWRSQDFKQAVAADSDRVVLDGRPWLLERPFTLDCRSDTFVYNVDTAINWASGNIVGFLRIYGHIGPKDFPGANVQDSSCELTEDTEAPEEFGALQVSGLGSPGALGIMTVVGL